MTFQVDLEIVTLNPFAVTAQVLCNQWWWGGRTHTNTHNTCTQKPINIGRRWVNVLTLFMLSGHVCLLCCHQPSWHAVMTLNSSVYCCNSYVLLFSACHRCCECRSESDWKHVLQFQLLGPGQCLLLRWNCHHNHR